MPIGVKNGVSDDTRVVTRPENPDVFLTRESLYRLSKPCGDIRKRSARRDLCNDLANLSARTCARELDDGDETNHEKNNQHHKHSKDFRETLHVYERPNAPAQ